MRRWSVVLITLLLGSVLWYWLAGRDAKPAKPVQPVAVTAAPAGVRAEGRVAAYPGAEVTLASEQAGTLTRLNCREKQRVRQGEVIAELRADETRAAEAEMRARVTEAEAEVRLAEADARRSRELATVNFVSRQAVERSDQAREAAQARVESARAALRRLSAGLDKSVIVAPIAGVVMARHASVGETLTPGMPLCQLANLDRLRIEAEVDEYDAGRVRLGMPVRIVAEGYDGQAWQGRVEEVPDSVGPRRLRPQDPSKPVDVRVLLVKVSLPSGSPLKLGQRVEVRLGDL